MEQDREYKIITSKHPQSFCDDVVEQYISYDVMNDNLPHKKHLFINIDEYKIEKGYDEEYILLESFVVYFLSLIINVELKERYFDTVIIKNNNQMVAHDRYMVDLYSNGKKAFVEGIIGYYYNHYYDINFGYYHHVAVRKNELEYYNRYDILPSFSGTYYETHYKVNVKDNGRVFSMAVYENSTPVIASLFTDKYNNIVISYDEDFVDQKIYSVYDRTFGKKFFIYVNDAKNYKTAEEYIDDMINRISLKKGKINEWLVKFLTSPEFISKLNEKLVKIREFSMSSIYKDAKKQAALYGADLRNIDVDERVAEVIASEKTGELVSDGQVKYCKKRVREKN